MSCPSPGAISIVSSYFTGGVGKIFAIFLCSTFARRVPMLTNGCELLWAISHPHIFHWKIASQAERSSRRTSMA